MPFDKALATHVNKRNRRNFNCLVRTDIIHFYLFGWIRHMVHIVKGSH